MSEPVLVQTATTQDELQAQMLVRWEVFVKEQNVPPVLEMDARDFLASTVEIFALSSKSGTPVGAARLLREKNGANPRYRVGRVAVVKEWRGRDIGTALMRFAESVVRSECNVSQTAIISLDAQLQAEKFYRQLGYVPTAKPQFMDAGIPHQEMTKRVGGDLSVDVGAGR